MRNRKYKYLIQLMYTSFFLVIVPMIFFYCGVWNPSYKEMQLLNTEYYNHSLSTFMSSFTDEVENFKREAIATSVKSRDEFGELSVFYYGTSKMNEYAYYYGEAVSKINMHGQEIGYDTLGVYYYEENVLLSSSGKYTPERYIQNVLHVSEYDKQAFTSFFSKDTYSYNKVLFAPIYDKEGKSEKILVGVCTILGKEKEQVILLCQFEHEDLEMSHITSNSNNRENYYVIDNETKRILFSAGATQEENLYLQEKLEEDLLDSDIIGLEIVEQRFFLKKDEIRNLTFIVDISGDIVYNRIISLYESVKLLSIYIVFVMLFICIFSIYYNYKPVNKLLKEVKSEGKYEFEAILNHWKQQKEMLTEQRIVIMDLLMNQLLYGVPISSKNIAKLGLSNKITSYCVFVIENYVLKVSEADEVIQTAESSFSALLFTTDIVGEKSTVLIAIMENDSSKELGMWIEEWTRLHIKEEYRLRKGHVVYEINEIQKSFAACMEIKKVSKEVKSRNFINDRLKEKVLDYLEEHFTDSTLSQQLLADQFQISVYTLSKMFNNQIGIGFSEYLNSKRIEYAKELLSNMDIPVKMVASMVGIPNDNYFSKTFKKYTGLSPIAYREEVYKQIN